VDFALIRHAARPNPNSQRTAHHNHPKIFIMQPKKSPDTPPTAT
jgi:hypothetical protein